MKIIAVITIVLAAASPAFARCYDWPLRRSHGYLAYDGDTIHVTVPGLPAELSKMSIRLDGVDTPEIRGKCEAERQKAKAARAITRRWLLAHMTDIRVCNPKWGKYAGRIVARIKSGNEDLTQALLKAGLGRVYHGGKRQGWCK